MSDLLFIVLYTLATHRITKFITQDEFPPIWNARQWVLNRWPGTIIQGSPDPSWQGYLVTCMWCVSVYVAAGLALVTAWAADMPWYMWMMLIPAASSITGLIGERSPD